MGKYAEEACHLHCIFGGLLLWAVSLSLGISFAIVGPLTLASAKHHAASRATCNCLVDAEITGPGAELPLMGLCTYPMTWSANERPGNALTSGCTKASNTTTTYTQNVTLPCFAAASWMSSPVGKHAYSCYALADPSVLLRTSPFRKEVIATGDFASVKDVRGTYRVGIVLIYLCITFWLIVLFPVAFLLGRCAYERAYGEEQQRDGDEGETELVLATGKDQEKGSAGY